MASVSGQCLCGAVRFTAEEAKLDHTACHCGMCRRWGGGPFLTTRVEGLEFQGVEPKRFVSSEWAERGFCPQCGTHLFYVYKPKNTLFVCVGTLDNSNDYQLATEYFIDEKPAGYAFVGDHPRMTGEELMG